jgi:hypothetical protein
VTLHRTSRTYDTNIRVDNVVLNTSEYMAMFRHVPGVSGDDDDDDSNANFDPMIVVYGEVPSGRRPVFWLEGAQLLPDVGRLPDGRKVMKRESAIYANEAAAAGTYSSTVSRSQLPLLTRASPLWRPTGNAAEYVPTWSANPTGALFGDSLDTSPRILPTVPTSSAHLYVDMWTDEQEAEVLSSYKVVSTPAFGASGARAAAAGDDDAGVSTLTITLAVLGGVCALLACCGVIGCAVVVAVRRRRRRRADAMAAHASLAGGPRHTDGTASRRVSRRPSRSMVRQPSVRIAVVAALLAVVAAQYDFETVSDRFVRAVYSDVILRPTLDIQMAPDGSKLCPTKLEVHPGTLYIVVYSTSAIPVEQYGIVKRKNDFARARYDKSVALASAAYDLLDDAGCVDSWTCPSLASVPTLRPFTTDNFGTCAEGFSATFLSDGDHHAGFVAVDVSDRTVYVSIKGTSSALNVLTDLNAAKVTDGRSITTLFDRPLFGLAVHSPAARVHAGFFEAALEIAEWTAEESEPGDIHERWTHSLADTVAAAARCARVCSPYLNPSVCSRRVRDLPGFADNTDALSEDDAPWTVVLTGHSMGGAVAKLLGLHLSLREPFTPSALSVYTMGAPRVGNAELAQLLAEQVPATYRIVNRYDPVAQVPLAIEAINFFGGRDPVEGGYRHTGTEFWWHSFGENWVLTPCVVGGSGRLNLESECCSIMAVLWRELTGMVDAVEDHRVARYVQLEPAAAVGDVLTVAESGLEGRAYHCSGWRTPGADPVPTDYPDPEGVGGYGAPTQLSVLLTDAMVAAGSRLVPHTGSSMRVAALVAGASLAQPFVSNWDMLMGERLAPGEPVGSAFLMQLPDSQFNVYGFVMTGAQLRALLEISLAQRCTSFFLHWSSFVVAYTQSDEDKRDVRIDSLTWQADGRAVGDAEQFMIVVPWDTAANGMYQRFFEDLPIIFGDTYGRAKLTDSLLDGNSEFLTRATVEGSDVHVCRATAGSVVSFTVTLAEVAIAYVVGQHELHGSLDIPQEYVDARISRTLVERL